MILEPVSDWKTFRADMDCRPLVFGFRNRPWWHWRRWLLGQREFYCYRVSAETAIA